MTNPDPADHLAHIDAMIAQVDAFKAGDSEAFDKAVADAGVTKDERGYHIPRKNPK